MKAILTVIGVNKIGIVASVSTELAALDINILDLSQTIVGGNFAMTMLCDLSSSTKSFREIKEALDRKGDQLAVKMNIQREEIFEAMHRV